jgi:tryptophan-rich sensory protein
MCNLNLLKNSSNKKQNFTFKHKHFWLFKSNGENTDHSKSLIFGMRTAYHTTYLAFSLSLNKLQTTLFCIIHNRLLGLQMQITFRTLVGQHCQVRRITYSAATAHFLLCPFASYIRVATMSTRKQ